MTDGIAKVHACMHEPRDGRVMPGRWALSPRLGMPHAGRLCKRIRVGSFSAVAVESGRTRVASSVSEREISSGGRSGSPRCHQCPQNTTQRNYRDCPPSAGPSRRWWRWRPEAAWPSAADRPRRWQGRRRLHAELEVRGIDMTLLHYVPTWEPLARRACQG